VELVAAGAANIRTDDKAVKEIIEKINYRTLNILEHLGWNREGFSHDTKNSKKVSRVFGAVKNVIDELPEYAGGEFVNCLLCMVEDIHSASVKFKNRALAYEWRKLAELLFDLYKADDQRLLCTNDMEIGKTMAEQIQAAINKGGR